MNGVGSQVVILVFIVITGVNLQFSFDYDNFDGAVAGANSFASSSSSSVVFNNQQLLQLQALPPGQLKKLGNNNNNGNKNNPGHGGPNPGKGNGNGNGNGKGNKNGHRGGNKSGNGNKVAGNYAANPFLQASVSPIPPPRPAPAPKPKPPAKKPAPAAQAPKPPKPPKAPKAPKPPKPPKPAKPAAGGNKKNNGGQKRVSQIKYEQYLTSIFPDMDVVDDVTDFTGRELARPGEFPHMGAIGYRNTVLKKTEYKCGASLISNLFAITSAHCTEFNGLKPNYVRFGDLNLKAAEEDVDPQTREIAQVINHPNYNDDLLYHDIALLQLAKPVIFTEFVRPIRLWYRDEVPFDNAFAMGFGAIQFAGAATNRLSLFNLTIIPNDVCDKALPKQPSLNQGISESQICALDLRKTGSDTFQGDSGGPLQISFYGRRRGRLHNNLIGITSFGVTGLNRFPGVYTRISYYVDWIEGIVWPNDYYE